MIGVLAALVAGVVTSQGCSSANCIFGERLVRSSGALASGSSSVDVELQRIQLDRMIHANASKMAIRHIQQQKSYIESELSTIRKMVERKRLRVRQ